MEGVSKLLEDMDIGLDNIGALVLSELVASPSLGKIERQGFLSGCAQANADTAVKLRNAVLQRTAKLPTDADLFKTVYNHTFQLALQPGQKAVPLEMATEFWRMTFGPDGWRWSTKDAPWLDWWIEFQEEKVKRSVNKDLWRQTFTFAEETMRDPTLSFWTEESSWPSVVDDFVEWVKTEKRGGGDEMEL